MWINVKSAGIYGEYFGAGLKVELKNPPFTVGQLLAILHKRYGVDFARQVMPPGGEDNLVALLVHGRHIGSQEGLETALADKDEVYFLVVIHGG